jgi:hypothetical protein
LTGFWQRKHLGLKCTSIHPPGCMFYEKLAMEVNASIAGFEVVKPAAKTGNSGVTHRFTFLASDGSKTYGFDVCREVGEIELLRSFVKKIDTDVDVYLVCLSGRPSTTALNMAASYGIQIIGPKEAGDFFSKRIVQLMAATE